PVSTSISAILGSMPVQLYVFGTINLSSLLSSLMVLYASAWIIRLGIPAVLCLSVPLLEPVAAPLVFLNGLLIRYQNFAVGFIGEHLPKTISISGSYLPGAVLIIVLFLLIVFAVHRGKKLPLAAFALSAVLLLVGTAADALTTYDRTKLLVFHSSYAECTAILRDDRAVVLSCSGSSATVGNFLAGHGTREIEALFIGEKESSIRCAEDLYESFRTDRIILPDTVYFRTDTTAEVYHYGTTSELEDDLTVNISAKGDYAAFTVNGTSIIFEQSDAGYAPETCDIAIADDWDSFARGELTLLLTEDDLLTAAPELTTGQYILTSEHEAVCLLIGRDGSYTIENG
ncbi:MAG: ComEC/Rec2 family competence protein, partial [Clostridia bacterium]|nr:ComEC/Rec2 family competence protein [Clostridia bacterium]